MILIALGGNLPGQDGAPSLAICRAAAAALARLPGLVVEAISPWYETAPLPPSGQPPYVNGVVRLKGVVEPAALLASLQAIEARFGRQRGVPNAARTLDLDIIDLNGILRDAPDPILPHPRAHERAFVLAPLADVAPEWRHPRLHRSAGLLLADLPPQPIRRLAVGSRPLP
uniref:2-amino-4-hydroxy-6-hydroxymethyldihydropteridine pyrophosphokinase n=1 Tax=Acidicaldus sp. TaxID=1872105 RepID=A0A8J4HE08_9PROT